MEPPPPAGEFDLIHRLTARIGHGPARLGPGDDAAIWHDGTVWTLDTLVEGVHFDATMPPEDLGYKALAVSVSDLMAMGAQPGPMLLSLSLPRADLAWIDAFARGLGEACTRWGVSLIGGDTTRSPGPVVASVTLGGRCAHAPMTRSGGRAGDAIWVSGRLGLAGQGWIEASPSGEALRALRRPDPPLELGLALAAWGQVTAAMDLSDGLAVDLPRLAAASGTGATVAPDAIPAADPRHAATGGEDYELLFTTPPTADPLPIAHAVGRSVTRIGQLTPAGLRFGDGPWPHGAFQHFGAA